MVDIKRGSEWTQSEPGNVRQSASIPDAAGRRLRSAISETGIRLGNGEANSPSYNAKTDLRLAHTRIKRTDIDPTADPKFMGSRFPGYGRL